MLISINTFLANKKLIPSILPELSVASTHNTGTTKLVHREKGGRVLDHRGQYLQLPYIS